MQDFKICGIPALQTWVDSQIDTLIEVGIVGLQGLVGAGKTTTIQCLAKALNVKNEVTSPTYALVQTYVGQWKGRCISIAHLDLYRLKNIDEAYEMGIEDVMAEHDFILIEWFELIEPLLPEKTIFLQLAHLPEGCRQIRMLLPEDVL